MDPIPEFNPEPELTTRDPVASREEVEPTNEFSAAPEEVPETHEAPPVDHNADVLITPPSPPPSAPAVPPTIPVTAAAEPQAQLNAELEAKYNDAQAEIQRLRALLAAAPEPSSAPPGLRRRNRALSDDGSTISGTDIGTMIDDHVVSPEGVPLQVVLIIALGVFITTYLFF